MPEKRFKVFASDGERVWGILFITQNPKGDFYAGPISPMVEFKASRHESGIWHLKGESLGAPKDSGERERPNLPLKEVGERSGRREPRRQRLSEFRGREEIFNLCVHISGFSRQAIGKPYDFKECDGAVLIDMRRYRCVGIQAHILEPGRLDLLSAFSEFMPDLQIALFTHTRPWLVVLVHSVSTEPLG